MIEKVRFKHIQGIYDGSPDYPLIMTEVLGFNNRRLGRKLVFAWKFKQCFKLVKEISELKPSKLSYSEDCEIKHPKHIDNISFRAMLEAQALSSNPKNLSIIDLMVELIAVTCYEANYKSDYDSESAEFRSFKYRIRNSSAIEMFGLYNWIDNALEESHLQWERRFMQVHIQDPDFEEAGASLANFNVILTLKTICRDFNISIDEAWLQSYALVQTNSLAIATQRFSQDQMRLKKEARMRQQRRQQTI